MTNPSLGSEEDMLNLITALGKRNAELVAALKEARPYIAADWGDADVPTMADDHKLLARIDAALAAAKEQK